VKRFLVVCAGSVALATGIAFAPMATAATSVSHGTGSSPQWTSRDVTISAPKHVSFAAVSGVSSDATSAQQPDLARPLLEANPSRTAADRAAAIQSGGRTSGVRALASPAQGTSVTPTEDLPLMNLDTQVADFPTDPDEDVEPPDTQVAAGPGYLVEVVNTTMSIYNDTGAEQASPADLNTFFSVPSGYEFTDPQAMYDFQSSRWFVSGWAYDSNDDSNTYLAVSDSSNPTGSWTFYTVQSNTSSTVTDQPMIGVCDNNVVMTWNEFTGTTSLTYNGAQALVLEKSALVASDSTVPSQEFTNTDEFRLVPARSESTPATCYMTVNNASVDLPGSTDTPTLGVIAVNGTAPSTTLTETDLPIAETYPPPDPSQPGGTTNDTQNDDRLVSAVWANNVLWTSATDACTPPGDTTVQNCMRLDEVSTSGTAPTLVQDFDLGTNGLDEYYPAVSLDSSGDLFVAYSASSSTQYPGAYAVISPASSVSSFTAPTTIEAGSASYTGTRWGDYSDAAPDPSVAGAVWVSGEYAPSDAAAPDWGTATAELTLPAGYPGVTSADSTTFTEGTAGSFTVTGSGSPTLTETGTLPTGVTFTSGVLSGTPAAGTAGSYAVEITATNSVGSVTQAFTLTVQPSGPLYTAIGPVRVLDTRNGTGAPEAPVGQGGSISLQIDGVDGVPATGVTAVVLNVTATDPTQASYVTVYPDGSTRPTASNLNFTAGETIPNLVTVPVGADGKVDFYNNSGSVQLVADLAGYYSSGTGSAFDSLGPVRVLDTRNGTGGYTGTVGAGQTLFLQATGVDGVPTNGVTAVVLNVTVTNPTTSGYVTVYPFGEAVPTASNLNFTAGETIPNQVIVPVNSFGEIGFYNFAGSVDLVADLAGYYTDTAGGSAFNSLGPVRVLDTRNGTGGFSAPVGQGGTISLQVEGVDGVPASGVTAVVLNVTAVSPTTSGYVTVYPDGVTRPTASNLNFTAGEVIPNLVTVPVGADGKIDFYNFAGSINLVADLAGYYTN
jgi:hypothetical protein